ncbi:MAG: hypothetical protein RIC15_03320, partial [Vicingaceae bacterium]
PPTRPTACNTAPRKQPANFPPAAVIAYVVFQHFILKINVRFGPGTYQTSPRRYDFQGRATTKAGLIGRDLGISF